MNKTIIAPSLLACDFLNIESELEALESISDLWLHLDVMDGHFVPNLTFGIPIIKMIAAKTKQPLDAHFMVTNPEFHIDALKGVALDVFTFHIEATNEPLRLIEKAKANFKRAGISLRPGTKLDLLTDDVLKAVDLVLVMSVEPGFGGQGYIAESTARIAELKQRRENLGAHFLIEVDGGINAETSKLAIAAGADILVAGSATFKGGVNAYQTNIETLRGNK